MIAFSGSRSNGVGLRERDLSRGSEAQPSLPCSFADRALTGPVFDLLSGRVWWSAWRWRLGQVRLGRALQATAVKHRAQSLQLQVSVQTRALGSSVHVVRPPPTEHAPDFWRRAAACAGPSMWLQGREAQAAWKAGLFNREAAGRIQ